MYPDMCMNILNKFQEKALILPKQRLLHHLGIIKFLLCFEGQFCTERFEQYSANQSLVISSRRTVPRHGCWHLTCSKVSVVTWAGVAGESGSRPPFAGDSATL